MARNPERTSRRNQKDLARRTKKKPCALCRDKVAWVDYKDVNLLRKYMSDRGKIRARRVTGNCSQHQRAVALAIKTARELVLLPYMQRTMTERSGGRGRGPRGERGGGPAGRSATRVADDGDGARRDERAEEVTKDVAESAEAVDSEETGAGNGDGTDAAAEDRQRVTAATSGDTGS
jgi:small subunit ribosomal protein S18